MFCPNCGTQNPDNVQFCSSCGTKLAQAQNPTPNPNQFGGGYKVNIKQRGIGMCILLSIITCGIYGIIWLIGMVDDLNVATGKNDTSGGTVFLLSLVTCGIYLYYWMYKAGEKVDTVRRMNGEAGNSSGITYLVLAILGFSIISYCLIQNELNKVAAHS